MSRNSELLDSAIALHERGEWDRARSIYQSIVRDDPRHARALYLLGLVDCQSGRYREAAAVLRRSIEEDETLAEAHGALGVALRMLNEPREAKASFERALALAPTDAGSHVNLATVLQEERNYADAEAHFLAALALQPDNVAALKALASIHFIRGNWDEAERHCQHVLRLQPADVEARHFRGTLLLLQGDLEQGWPEYEYRLECPGVVPHRSPQPRWDGTANSRQTLLLHSEYGLGDAIQFLRYVPWARERAARVFIEVPKQLLPILESSGFADLVASCDELPRHDARLPLTSLPCVFKTKLASIPQATPYISARSDFVEKWKDRLAGLSGFRVGIHWQGNEKYKNDPHRSMALEHFAPLAAVPGVRLISLQKGPGLAQLRELSDRFNVFRADDLDEHRGAFMDTAAILAQLDLVITSDSAVAHLAGAMGRPVWMATSYAPDWRWLLEREDSPWYPTMRLFRQRRLDDWGEVFDRIAGELDKAVKASFPRTA